MNTTWSRSRRASSASPPSLSRLAIELQPVIDALDGVCKQHQASAQEALGATECLLRLRHTFIDHERPREAKDAFRQLQGFQTLLNLLRRLTDLYDPTAMSKPDRKSLLTLLRDVHAVLAESLKDHPGNKWFFAKGLEGS